MLTKPYSGQQMILNTLFHHMEALCRITYIIGFIRKFAFECHMSRDQVAHAYFFKKEESGLLLEKSII